MVHAHLIWAPAIALLASLPLVRDRAGAPYFSIIVYTWQRTEFIEQAVRSVLAQSVARTDYEIIVVRGYSNAPLDAVLSGMGAHVLATPTSSQGAALALGVTAAQGQVLVFLEDDDEFEPTKLATLRAEFEEDPDLALVRNANRCIDAAGRPLLDWPNNYWPALPVTTTEERRTPGAKSEAPSLPIHNLSSISVRRDAVAPCVSCWSTIPSAADSLVYLSALGSPGVARFDERVLTRRRVHASTSLENFSAEGIGPPPSLERLRRLDLSHRQQLAMVRGSPAETTARWLEVIHRFEAAMSASEFPSPDRRDYLDMVRGMVRERQLFRAWIVGFSLLRRIAPERAIRTWWRFNRESYRRVAPGINYGGIFLPGSQSRTSPHSPH